MDSVVNIYSEEDAQNKIMIPLLKKLGYKLSDMEFQKPIKITIGSNQKTIYPDIVVKIGNRESIVVEMKKPGVKIDEIAVEQAISYARLMPIPVPYAVVSNGYDTRIYDVITKQRLPEIPTKKKYLELFSSQIMNRTISEEQKEEAKKFLMGFSDVKAFAKVLSDCHDYIRAHEGLDPTAAFDEISKILFIKMHEEIDAEENNRQSKFTVKKFREEGFDYINSVLFKDTKRKFAGLFDENERINLKIKTIEQIAMLLENYSLRKTDIDIKGVAFETFLSKTFRGEGLGQYFTPREIVNFMVELTSPKINYKILDPACGSGGFLKACYRKIKEDINSSNFTAKEKKKLLKNLAEKQLYGVDINPRLAQTCKMNMIVHGDGNTGIYRHNGLLDIDGIIDKNMDENEKFDLILTNPPFGSTIKDSSIISQFKNFGVNNGKVRKSIKSEVLFIERCLDLLKPGGELAIIVPDGILSNVTYNYVRKGIKERAIIKAIISLPSDAFISRGATVKTSILYLKKKQSPEDVQGDVFMAIAEKIGYDTTGKEIPENDLPGILMKYREYVEENDINFTNTPSCFVTRWSDIGDRLDVKYYLPIYINNNTFLEEKFKERLANLKDVAKLIKRGNQPKYSETGVIPVVKTADIQNNKVNWGNCLKVDLDFYTNKSVKGHEQDILLASTGVGSLGKVAYVDKTTEFCVDSHITIIRLPKDTSINPYFLFAYLQTKYGKLQIEQKIRGATGQIEIYPEDIKSIKIPCLDIETQQKIIELKKTSLMESESLIKQSLNVLNEVENFIYEELGINNISANDNCFIVDKRNISKNSRLDVEYYNLLYNENLASILENSKFPIIRLAKFINNCTNMVDPSKYPDNKYEILSVHNDGTITCDRVMRGAEFNQKYKLVKTGQVTYNPYRINIGSIGVIPERYNNKLISPAYVVFETANKLNPIYLTELLRTKLYKKYLDVIGTGSVRTSIQFSTIKNILIPLPDIKIQNEIVNQIISMKQMSKQNLMKSKAVVEEANLIIEEIIENY